MSAANQNAATIFWAEKALGMPYVPPGSGALARQFRVGTVVCAFMVVTLSVLLTAGMLSYLQVDPVTPIVTLDARPLMPASNFITAASLPPAAPVQTIETPAGRVTITPKTIQPAPKPLTPFITASSVNTPAANVAPAPKPVPQNPPAPIQQVAVTPPAGPAPVGANLVTVPQKPVVKPAPKIVRVAKAKSAPPLFSKSEATAMGNIAAPAATTATHPANDHPLAEKPRVEPATAPARPMSAAPHVDKPVDIAPGERLGIRAISPDGSSVTLTNGAHVKVGGAMPNGELLIGADPAKNRLETDRRVMVITP